MTLELSKVIQHFNPGMIAASGLFEVLWAWAPEDSRSRTFNRILCPSLEAVRDALQSLEPIEDGIEVRYAAPAAFIRRKAKAYRLAQKRKDTEYLASLEKKQLELF